MRKNNSIYPSLRNHKYEDLKNLTLHFNHHVQRQTHLPLIYLIIPSALEFCSPQHPRMIPQFNPASSEKRYYLFYVKLPGFVSLGYFSSNIVFQSYLKCQKIVFYLLYHSQHDFIALGHSPSWRLLYTLISYGKRSKTDDSFQVYLLFILLDRVTWINIVP